MRRRIAEGVVGALVAAGMMLVTSAPPVMAATIGRERFDGFLAVSGASGGRQVLASGIVARGVFNGVGKIVERQNLPSDPKNANRDDLVFRAGVLRIVSIPQGNPSFVLDRRSCVATFKVQQTTRFDGGTRRFAHATGRGTGKVVGRGILQRAPDGRCDLNRAPLFELDIVSGSGSLSF
jgi:hypothetical protein